MRIAQHLKVRKGYVQTLKAHSRKIKKSLPGGLMDRAGKRGKEIRRLSAVAAAVEHFDESADAGAQLFGIIVGVVGFDGEAGNARFFESAGNGAFLGIIEITELQIAVDDAVNLCLLYTSPSPRD